MSNPAPKRDQPKKAAPASMFSVTQRMLVAERDAERLRRESVKLNERLEYQSSTIQGLWEATLQAWRDSEEKVQRAELSGLTIVAAMVRTAGGLVRVPELFLADNTGTMNGERDVEKKQWVYTWSPAELVEKSA